MRKIATNYRTTALGGGFEVSEIMSFFTTCFSRSRVTVGRRESYPYWAMIYTMRGELTFSIDEELLHIRSGELIFYPANRLHSITAIDSLEWEVSFVTFKCESSYLESFVGRAFVPDRELSNRIQDLFRFGSPLFYNLPQNGSNTVGMYCNGDMEELMYIKSSLEFILSSLYLSVRRNRSFERANPAFLKAVEYMKSNLGMPITLSLLAKEVGVSVSTLKKAFEKESGGGVNQYYIKMKLARGAELLTRSAMTVGEIAEKLGFSSQFYFSEQFKKHYGVSPTAYRKQQSINCIELI